MQKALLRLGRRVLTGATQGCGARPAVSSSAAAQASAADGFARRTGRVARSTSPIACGLDARSAARSRFKGRRGRARRSLGARMIRALVRAGQAGGRHGGQSQVIRNLLEMRVRARSGAIARRSRCSCGSQDPMPSTRMRPDEELRSCRVVNSRGAGRCAQRRELKCSAAPPGCGRARRPRTPSTCCSWTRRGRCRWPTCSPLAGGAESRAARRSAAARTAAEGQSSRRRRRLGAEHVLGGAHTMPDGSRAVSAGDVAARACRSAPSPRSCSTTEAQVARAGLEHQRLARDADAFDGAGLWLAARGARRQSQLVARRRSKPSIASSTRLLRPGVALDRREHGDAYGARVGGHPRRGALQRARESAGRAPGGAARCRSGPSTSFRGRKRRS